MITKEQIRKIFVKSETAFVDTLYDELNKLCQQKQHDFNGHEYVDLGLPSGTLWAKKNVGADSETDYGLYFAWGETKGFKPGKRIFDWPNYKYDEPNGTCIKYNDRDNKKVLDLDDDAAHVNMGGEWRMPTREQIKELFDNTTYETTEKCGVKGMLFRSKVNCNTLFVPFAAYANNGSVNGTGYGGFVWSSSLDSSNVNLAFNLDVHDRPDAVLYSNLRYIGRSVRGVVQH